MVTEPGHTGADALGELAGFCGRRRCGHTRDSHQHFRQGTDCALCRCPRYRREPVRARFARLIEFLVAE